MKKIILPLLIIAFLATVAPAKILRIELMGDLVGDDVKSPIFQGTVLIPQGEEREVFTGPYTIALAFEENYPRQYNFTASLYGLKPDLNISKYKFTLGPSETMLIPPVPVKEGVTAEFHIILLDDTTGSLSTDYPLSDSSLWGESQSIHYLTYWVKGSLIDFTWNNEIGYLEFIYNKYRESYKLSEFDKIDTYIHPEVTDEVYLDSESNYSIQPRKRRIDVVYGHKIKALSPIPACELLVYRQWGYGPRWMVDGLARYYDDNNLENRDYIKDFDKDRLRDLLKDEDRVTGDTGLALTGAMVFWLLQNESFGEFKSLYTGSTALDFDKKFGDIYGYDFDDFLGRFLEYAKSYKAVPGELDYYALSYFNRGNMKKAKRYYEELAILGEGNRIDYLQKLGTCLFWLGNYAAADTIYDTLIKLGDESGETLYMKADVELALGKSDKASGFFKTSYDRGFPTGGVRLASLLLDEGKTDSAFTLLENIKDEAGRLLEYSLEIANMKVMKGEKADSLLENVIGRAINMSNNSADDPRPYEILGKAYSLAGEYDSSISQYNTAYFLETNPYLLSSILLEMGRTEDISGDRESAKQYYRRVLDSAGGEYQKSLAKKYLHSAYRRK